METINLPISKNPRRNDKAVKPVMESIKQFGFKVPLVLGWGAVVVCAMSVTEFKNFLYTVFDNYFVALKPIALCAKCIRNSSQQDDVVLDLFGRSGSTLIACEQINRRCYSMELNPVYCDVIVKRWETLTGRKAEVISA